MAKSRAAWIFAITLFIPMPAHAYRPFQGTDAAVAKPAEVEIELQPAGIQRQGPASTLIGPATVINIGLTTNWEAVFEGQLENPMAGSEGGTRVTGLAAFLKGILRPGSLQDKDGPSIATEFGVLAPGVNAEPGVGASLAAIVSQRWDWGTVHINLATALTRTQHADLFVGAIVEGPQTWKVRPVSEVFYEDEIGQSRTVSMLAGAIWQLNDDLSFDVGLRHASTNGQSLNELRAGLTFAFPLKPRGARNP